MSLTIVMYHYVRQLEYTKHPKIKGLLLSNFKKQISYFKEKYEFITMSDLIGYVKEERESLPDNSILLTFDDAYIDHYTNVFPVLEFNNISGAFFPPSKAILDHEVLDVNKIHFILASSTVSVLIPDIKKMLVDLKKSFQLDSFEDYYSKLAVEGRWDNKDVIFIKRLLQVELPEEVRNLIVDSLFKKYVCDNEGVFSRELYMNRDQLKCMRRNGMYIGSHGHDHYWLDSLSSEKQIDEIDKSLDFLESIGASTENWAMCYPYGAYNPELVKNLRAKKCSLGLTTNVGVVDLEKDDPMTFSRMDTNDFLSFI